MSDDTPLRRIGADSLRRIKCYGGLNDGRYVVGRVKEKVDVPIRKDTITGDIEIERCDGDANICDHYELVKMRFTYYGYVVGGDVTQMRDDIENLRSTREIYLRIKHGDHEEVETPGPLDQRSGCRECADGFVMLGSMEDVLKQVKKRRVRVRGLLDLGNGAWRVWL